MTHLFISHSQKAIKEEIEKRVSALFPNTTNVFSTSEVTPDLHILQAEESKSIGIKEISDFIYGLSKKPFREKVQIGILLDLDHATVQAQNKLLKELEDHADSTIYLLGVQNEGNILPTIKSRATVTYIEAEPSSEEKQELDAIVSTIVSSKDILDIYSIVSNEQWNKLKAELVLSQIYTHISQKGLLNKARLKLFSQMGEYLNNNVSPKHVLLFFIFAFRNKI